MKVYTYTEARQKLADLLDRAGEKGEVLVRRRDGREYVVRPRRAEASPLRAGRGGPEPRGDRPGRSRGPGAKRSR